MGGGLVNVAEGVHVLGLALPFVEILLVLGVVRAIAHAVGYVGTVIPRGDPLAAGKVDSGMGG